MEFKEAVKTALENEKKGRKMYIEFTERAKNSVTKKTFEFLANEELRHVEKIQEIAESLGSEHVDVPDLHASTLEKMKEIFGVSVKEFNAKAKIDSSDVEAHELAMDFEEKSYEFYKELSEKASDRKVKKFFDALMKEEENHYEFIEKACNFIKNPEGFYSEEEGWLLEG